MHIGCGFSTPLFLPYVLSSYGALKDMVVATMYSRHEYVVATTLEPHVTDRFVFLEFLNKIYQDKWVSGT